MALSCSQISREEAELWIKIEQMDNVPMCGYTHTLMDRSISTNALPIAHGYVSGPLGTGYKYEISNGRPKQSYLILVSSTLM